MIQKHNSITEIAKKIEKEKVPYVLVIEDKPNIRIISQGLTPDGVKFFLSTARTAVEKNTIKEMN